MPPPVLPSDFAPAGGPAPSLFDTVAAGFSKGLVQHSSAEERRVAEVVNAAWRKLQDDSDEDTARQLARLQRQMHATPQANADPTQSTLMALDAWRARLPPSERGKIPTRLQLTTQARQMDLDQYTAADRVLERATGLSGGAAAFTGGVGGAMLDPINLAALAVAKIPAMSILRTAALEAGVSTVTQAAIEPFTADYMNDLGIDYDWRDSAQNILYGTAGGAVFGAGARSIEKGVVRMRGGVPIDELRRQGLDPDAIRAAVREAEAAREAETVRSARQVADDVRAMFDDSPYRITARPSAAAAAAAARHTTDAVRATEEIVHGAPSTPPPDGPAPATAPRDVAAVSEGRIEIVDLASLKRDPKTFQYKDSDADGVTAALKDVKAWDPEKAGVIMVWEGAGGDRFVVNGHQRHHLADVLRQQGHDPISAPIYVLKESDGVTAEQAMIKGAMVNLAEGSGSAVDAAIVLRNATDEFTIGLPPNNPLVRDATGLARLSEDAFYHVSVHGADPKLAAQVGRLVEDGDLHTQMIDALERMRPRGEDEAAHMIRDLLSVPVVERETIDLFGAHTTRDMLIAERARVKQAAMLRLAKDKGLFRAAVQRQAELESRGNKLARDQNLAAMDADTQAALRLEKEAHVKGWVSDALNEAARRLRDGEPTTRIVDDVVKALRAGDPGGARVRGPDGAAGRGAERADQAGPAGEGGADGADGSRPATQKELKDGGAAAYVTELVGDASADDIDRVLAWLGRDRKSVIEDAYRALTGDSADLPPDATKASVLSLVRDAVRRAHTAQEPIDELFGRLYAPDPDLDRYMAADQASRRQADEGAELDLDARAGDDAARAADEARELDAIEQEIRDKVEAMEGLDDQSDLFIDPETGTETTTAAALSEIEVDKKRLQVLEACAFPGGRGAK